MKVKISELTGAALDWAVAKCEGILDPVHGEPQPRVVLYSDRYEPSTDWAQGGPILQREGISIIFHEQGHWTASNLHGTVCGEGPTPLITGMRCYCCSKLGDEVEVPEELL